MNMRIKIITFVTILLVVGLTDLPLVAEEAKQEKFNVEEIYAFKFPPEQGTIIPCEICVVLYPKRYEKEPKLCPICQGVKEHFEAAQMMTREMAQMRLNEIDMEIQEHLHEALIVSLEEHVDVEQLKDLRELYMRKLIHLLVHGFLEVEPVKEKILQMDEMIEM